MNWLTWLGMLLTGLSFLFDDELSGDEAGEDAGTVSRDSGGAMGGLNADGSTAVNPTSTPSYASALGGVLSTAVETVGNVATSWGPAGVLTAGALVTEGPQNVVNRISAWFKKYWWILLILGAGVFMYFANQQPKTAEQPA